ncbi:MAG: phosphoribosyltransferase [Candidatus Micrarchaeia archaeon]
MFKDREEAGELLAQRIKGKIKGNEIVIGIANGGVIVAKQIAAKFSLRLFSIVIKKIPSSIDPELGVGAVASDGTIYLNKDIIETLSETKEELNKKINEKIKEAKEKEKIFGKLPEVKGKRVILIDDGAATGASVFAAIKSLKKKEAKIIVALPVASKEVFEKLKREEVEDVVCLIVDEQLTSVGEYYQNFEHVEDEKVLEALNQPNQ